jgi:hypothetical protein
MVMTLKVAYVELALALGGVFIVADSAMSESAWPKIESTVGIEDHSEAQVKAACTGYYGMPNDHGTYYCVNQDGSGIMCGGAAENKGTCDTFTVPKESNLVSGEPDLLSKILAAPRATTADVIPDEVFESSAKKCVKCGDTFCCPK